MKPEELLYAETHEWVHVAEQDGQQVATLGISAFAVEQLNDLVYMDLPSVGKQLERGEEFGEVESVKAVSPLYSPLAGEVIAVNEQLPEHLEWLNEEPYGKGWVIRVRLSDADGLQGLMDHAAYQKQCAESG